MTSINLLPCPFCGGEADSRCTAGPDPDWFVECTECLASAPVFSEDKLDGWNSRAQPIGTSVELDERMAFERFCVDSFNRCLNPRIPMKIECMQAARSGEKYTARGWTDMWKGWKARAALDQGGGTAFSQKGEEPANG